MGYSLPQGEWVSWVSPILGTVMYVWGGSPFLTGGVSEIRSRQPGMMLLISMAISVAFIASWVTSLRIGGFDTTISFYGEDTNIARRLAQAGRIVFDLRLVMRTSARRLEDEGFVATAVKYALNFGSEVFLKRPLTRQYRDVR